mmetsp:Transcript_20456/g.52850  ORF Transcript_20456/g.52850 Transcript_20456/m.52850 type:complete len:245 (-) Transcript_20456:1636-2370(-)
MSWSTRIVDAPRLRANVLPISPPSSSMKQWPCVSKATLSFTSVSSVPWITKQRWWLERTRLRERTVPGDGPHRCMCAGYRPSRPCWPIRRSSTPCIACGADVFITIRCPPIFCASSASSAPWITTLRSSSATSVAKSAESASVVGLSIERSSRTRAEPPLTSTLSTMATRASLHSSVFEVMSSSAPGAQHGLTAASRTSVRTGPCTNATVTLSHSAQALAPSSRTCSRRSADSMSAASCHSRSV